MQGYTQYGGLRPFGVSLLYAGWDAQNKYQLYQSDPSGNYGGWKATAIGANQQARHLAMLMTYLPRCIGRLVKLARLGAGCYEQHTRM